jgi:hypothetical protein
MRRTVSLPWKLFGNSSEVHDDFEELQIKKNRENFNCEFIWLEENLTRLVWAVEEYYAASAANDNFDKIIINKYNTNCKLCIS